MVSVFSCLPTVKPSLLGLTLCFVGGQSVSFRLYLGQRAASGNILFSSARVSKSKKINVDFDRCSRSYSVK